MASIFRASHRLLTAGCLLALLARASVAAVVYVNINCPGPVHDGKSWATAFQSVQEGIDAAAGGNEVWVAQGTYSENVHLGGVSLYGGFAGTETQPSQRDHNANVTILDGDRKAAVAVIGSSSLTSVLDGFTVRNGKSDTAGGISVSSGTTVISHNIIDHNVGGDFGGGIRITGGTVTVFANLVSNNGVLSGAGFYGGSGIYVSGGTVRIADNVISSNYGAHSGGGIFITSGGASTRVLNNTIVNNSASQVGGGIYTEAYIPVVNNVIAFNSAYRGGGIFHANDIAPHSYYSNDFFGNDGYDCFSTSGLVDLSGNNISADPNLSSDYHPDSSCTDAGSDGVITAGERDAAGRLRIIGAHVDIGAFESGATDNYTLPDAVSALAAMGGLSDVTPSDFAHLNVDRGGTSANAVDMYDAVWIVRRALGVDPA